MFSSRSTLIRFTRRWVSPPRASRVSSWLSTTTTTSTLNDDFVAKAPSPLTLEIAEGIADTTQFLMRHGISRQRLEHLAGKSSGESGLTVLQKWQKMMEIFLMTQLHVISSIGYPSSEEGLGRYAHDLQNVLQSVDPDTRTLLSDLRRDTWRDMVSTAYELDPADIPVLGIVEARNLMHKVSSKMMEPEVLLHIQTMTAKIEHENPEIEVQMKHQILQDVIVNKVYFGGSPQTLVEELGFGSGADGYAKIQCAMSDHEGDPLVAQYAGAAMMRIWQAAGIDVSSITQGQPEAQGGQPLS